MIPLRDTYRLHFKPTNTHWLAGTKGITTYGSPDSKYSSQVVQHVGFDAAQREPLYARLVLAQAKLHVPLAARHLGA